MKSLALLGVCALLFALIFQCCPSAASEVPLVEVPTEEAAPPPSEPSPEETAAPTLTDEPAPTSPPSEPSPPPEPTATSPPPSPTPAPQAVLFEFNGQGDEATQLYSFEAGLIRCDYTYVGEHNFIAYLLDSRGSPTELLANEIGSCQGSSAGNVRSAGDYLLDVSSDGDWTFRCEANARGAQPSPRQPVAVVQSSGQGDEASQFFHLEAGLVRSDYTYVGEHNFIAYLLDSQGNPVELVANEIGSCQGSTAGSIRSAGDFLLDVTASGSWTIILSQ